MFEKQCRICEVWFTAKTERRQLCDNCQKHPARAQREIDRAILDSKRRLGEMPDQQYYAGICKYCGREFHSYGREKEFCGPECAKEYRMRTAVCPICKKQLYPLGIFVKSGEKCCSGECAAEYRMRKARSAGKAAHCKQCGKEFIQKNDWDKFCGSCEKWYEADGIFPTRKEGMKIRCKVCGKAFTGKTPDDKTCSAACYEVYQKALPTRMLECKCEICGKPFQRHINTMQYTCGKECSAVRRKAMAEAEKTAPTPMLECKCEICGKPFQRYVNAVQYTCGKECAAIRRKAIAEAESREKRAKELAARGERRALSVPEAKRNPAAQPDREQLINGVKSGAVTEAEARKLHLCTQCRTSQKECEWFSSRFSCLPQGAVAHISGSHTIVLTCPKCHF